MTIFLGTLGLLLGLMVMLAGAITFIRGLPDGVRPRPGQANPRGNLSYLVNQQCLGLGVVLLALDVVLRLAGRPFLLPGLVLLAVPFGLFARRRWRTLLFPERRPRVRVGKKAGGEDPRIHSQKPSGEEQRVRPQNPPKES
jgi:hypothetical protein